MRLLSCSFSLLCCTCRDISKEYSFCIHCAFHCLSFVGNYLVTFAPLSLERRLNIFPSVPSLHIFVAVEIFPSSQGASILTGFFYHVCLNSFATFFCCSIHGFNIVLMSISLLLDPMIIFSCHFINFSLSLSPLSPAFSLTLPPTVYRCLILSELFH